MIPTHAVTLQGDTPRTTSLMVAEVFGKRHDNVLRDIETLLQTGGEIDALKSEGVKIDALKSEGTMERHLKSEGTMERHLKSGCAFLERQFTPRTYEVPGPKNSVRQETAYELTEQGFMLLVMGYSGAKALQLKIAYVQQFDAMRAELRALGALLNDQITPVQIGVLQDTKVFSFKGEPMISTRLISPTYVHYYNHVPKQPSLVPFEQALIVAPDLARHRAQITNMFPKDHPYRTRIAA